MHTLKLYCLRILPFILLYNCSDNSGTEKVLSEASNYKLAIVDSVQIDILGSSLSVVDVHDETGDLLVIQPSPPKLWIISQEGEIKTTWEKNGDGPDEIGAYLLSAEFIGEGVAMMGYLRLKIFDKDFKVIASHKPHFNLQGMLYMGFNHLMAFERGGNEYLVTYFGGPQTDKKYDSPEFYEELNVVDVIDPMPMGDLETETSVNKGQFLPVGRLDENSRFKQGERSYFYLKPTFDVKEQILTYAYNWDTVLYKLTLPSGELLESHPIPFDEFYLNKGFTMGKAVAEMNDRNRPPSDRPGNIDRVFQSNGFDLVFYRSGLPLERIQAVNLEGVELSRKLNEMDFQKHLILNDGVRMNKDLGVMKSIIAPSVVDKQGFIWANQNVYALDEEPDLVTFYKLKIVADEE